MELEVGIVGLLIIIGHWEVHLRNDQCMVSVHIQWKEIIQGLFFSFKSYHQTKFLLFGLRME